ncbi:hypothetical protein BRADI_3g40679v3 [Brachypodium distachyon]|uniref:Uncharacterized protein n=1 Tax=Brachypodium distachyon TaxID=15368 RepID=A0A2K2D2D0_BRADI|nr:hypothetical protein BRADI_3g40679v3 [Brachypodium distachyon]
MKTNKRKKAFYYIFAESTHPRQAEPVKAIHTGGKSMGSDGFTSLSRKICTARVGSKVPQSIDAYAASVVSLKFSFLCTKELEASGSQREAQRSISTKMTLWRKEFK